MEISLGEKLPPLRYCASLAIYHLASSQKVYQHDPATAKMAADTSKGKMQQEFNIFFILRRGAGPFLCDFFGFLGDV